jgi:hypothetical protein
MARIRTIKPDIWEDEKAGKLDFFAALNFIGLISLADDEGRGRGDPAWLASRLHPYRTPTVAVMDESLKSIGVSGLAVFYSVNGQSYYWVPKFKEHQVINKPKPSRLPPPPSPVRAESGTDTELARAEWNGMESEVEVETEGKGGEEDLKGEGRTGGSPLQGATALPMREIRATMKEINRSAVHLRGKAKHDAIEARKRELGLVPKGEA